MKSPAFSLYVRDWLCSNTVSKLHSKAYSKDGSNPLSRCLNAFTFLLFQSWLQEPTGTLPGDDEELADLARVTPDEWKAMKPLIQLAFKVTCDGRWYHERLMAEVLKQQNRSKSGSKGGSKKQANRVAKHVAALENEIEVENEKETTKPLGLVTPASTTARHEAELIYAAYPLKVGRPKAIEAILRAMRKHSPERLLTLTKHFAEVRGTDMAFVAHPATWFNQERFNDDPATWTKAVPEMAQTQIKPLSVKMIEEA